MDLGTMGIPREVAQLNQQNNFLFNSNNQLGPGDYQPMPENIQRKPPAAGFGKLPGNNKHTTAMWEEKLEKYIGVKPSEQGKVSPKKAREQSANATLPSFEEQMRSKPSFMFASSTERKVVDTGDQSMPGPQHYASSVVHLMKKDFSRPRIVIAQPTRNLDGAIRNDPYLASNELKHKNISPGPAPLLDYPGAKLQERQRTEPRMRQYGLNMITNTLQDPD